MEKIEYTGHVVQKDPDQFSKGLDILIKDAQSRGFEVEVQYTTITTLADHAYTALVIGRKVNTQ